MGGPGEWSVPIQSKAFIPMVHLLTKEWPVSKKNESLTQCLDIPVLSMRWALSVFDAVSMPFFFFFFSVENVVPSNRRDHPVRLTRSSHFLHRGYKPLSLCRGFMGTLVQGNPPV